MGLLWSCVLWVLASVAVALLPMRYQFVPGLALLVLAPVLIFWVGAALNWWAAGLALCAFVSMFRNPLRYFWARGCGAAGMEVPK